MSLAAHPQGRVSAAQSVNQQDKTGTCTPNVPTFIFVFQNPHGGFEESWPRQDRKHDEGNYGKTREETKNEGKGEEGGEREDPVKRNKKTKPKRYWQKTQPFSRASQEQQRAATAVACSGYCEGNAVPCVMKDRSP